MGLSCERLTIAPDEGCGLRIVFPISKHSLFLCLITWRTGRCGMCDGHLQRLKSLLCVRGSGLF